MLPFVPSLFARTLAGTLVVVSVCLAMAWRIYGEVATRDLVGSLVSAFLFAYLLHLWLIPQERSEL